MRDPIPREEGGEEEREMPSILLGPLHAHTWPGVQALSHVLPHIHSTHCNHSAMDR